MRFFLIAVLVLAAAWVLVRSGGLELPDVRLEEPNGAPVRVEPRLADRQGDVGPEAGMRAGHSSRPARAPRTAPRDPTRTPPGEPGIYRYTDEDGNLRFVSSLDQVPAQLRGAARPAGRGTLSRADAGPVRRPRPPPPAAFGHDLRRNADVVVYTTSWCGYCRKTLAWLDARGIPYENRDVEADPRHRAALIRKTGGTGVPLVEVDGQPVRGYDPGRLARLLAAD